MIGNTGNNVMIWINIQFSIIFSQFDIQIDNLDSIPFNVIIIIVEGIFNGESFNYNNRTDTAAIATESQNVWPAQSKMLNMKIEGFGFCVDEKIVVVIAVRLQIFEIISHRIAPVDEQPIAKMRTSDDWLADLAGWRESNRTEK